MEEFRKKEVIMSIGNTHARAINSNMFDRNVDESINKLVPQTQTVHGVINVTGNLTQGTVGIHYDCFD